MDNADAREQVDAALHVLRTELENALERTERLEQLARWCLNRIERRSDSAADACGDVCGRLKDTLEAETT